MADGLCRRRLRAGVCVGARRRNEDPEGVIDDARLVVRRLRWVAHGRSDLDLGCSIAPCLTHTGVGRAALGRSRRAVVGDRRVAARQSNRPDNEPPMKVSHLLLPPSERARNAGHPRCDLRSPLHRSGPNHRAWAGQGQHQRRADGGSRTSGKRNVCEVPSVWTSAILSRSMAHPGATACPAHCPAKAERRLPASEAALFERASK